MHRPRSDAVTSRHRLRDYDYSLPGDYYITIVTGRRVCLFGHADDEGMHLSPAGAAMDVLWRSIPERFPHVELDEFVVMPNHLHGLISILADDSGERFPDSPSASGILHWYKTRSTTVYGYGVREDGWPRYAGHLWQTGFIDRVLRNERELEQKREYILANPYQWQHDPEYRDT